MILFVPPDDNDGLGIVATRRAESLHHLDSVILLTYISVLVLVVLTAWLFKHARFRFIHESGVTLFFGLLIGFVIRYFNIGQLQSATYDVVLKNHTVISEPPDYLRLEVKPDDVTKKVSFHYELIEGFYADSRKQNEKKIDQKSSFSPEIFFNILLPPIIFNAGYSLKKRHFFRNIGSILAFVFIGTTASCLITGSLMYIFTKIFGMGFSFQELMFFGALISATDPVTILSIFNEMNVESDLFALIFGESALNDAVAIVLTNIIDGFTTSSDVLSGTDLFSLVWRFFSMFFASLFLGSAIGCGCALLTKMTRIADHHILESSLFILFSYISFLLAEVLGFTGVVSVLFCGICQAHYTYNNLSPESQGSTKHFFAVIAFVLESFIFCYIGVSVFVANNQKLSLGFLFFGLVAVVIARAMFVYPLCSLINLKRRPQIPPSYQHMITFSGLRGAVAFALAARNTATENRQIICSTTVAIVLFTVFVNGGAASWFIEYLGIKHGPTANVTGRRINEDEGISLPDNIEVQLPEGISPHEFLSEQENESPLTPAGSNPWDKAFLPRKWYNFDASFMKPLLTHATPSLEQTLPPSCYPLARIFTSNQQRARSHIETCSSGSFVSLTPTRSVRYLVSDSSGASPSPNVT